MKKEMRSLLSLVLLATTIFPGTAFASENTAIPADIKPAVFNSNEEAVQYLNNISGDIKTESTDEATNRGHVIVAKEDIGTVKGKMELRLSYTTSGEGDEEHITSVDPYALAYGFPYGFKWKEDNIGAEIASNGKDVYVHVDGLIEYYVLEQNEDFSYDLKTYEAPVSLNGTVSIIK